MYLEAQIISDIHIEKGTSDILAYLVPSAKTLLIAGDVGPIYNDQKWFEYIRFMASAARSFTDVYFVPGDHEYRINTFEPRRSLTMDDVDQKLSSLSVMY